MQFSYGNIGFHGPLEQTCRSIAELGFEGIEIFQLLYLHEEDFNFRRLLDDYRLKLSSTFFCSAFVDPAKYPAERADFAQAAKLVYELGGRQILLAGGKLRRNSEEDDRKRFIGRLNDLGRAARDNGVKLAFHPHKGTLIYSAEDIAQMLHGTDPQFVGMAVDIAHLGASGIEPIDFLNQNFGRIAYMQFKDWNGEEFSELGKGKLPVKKCFDTLLELGYDGWLAIELDASEDPLHSARLNAEFLRSKLNIQLSNR